MLARADEIGTLSRSFDLMIAELADARQRLIEWSEAEISKQYERLDGVINNMSQGVCMYDAEQKLIICQQSLCRNLRPPARATRVRRRRSARSWSIASLSVTTSRRRTIS